MAHYFPVSIRGSGTRDVEYFGSYATRVAKWHGVSVHQFFSHFAAWWRTTGDPRELHVPTYDIEFLIHDVSSNLPLLVSAMEAGLGVSGLRATTLIALSDVCGYRSNTMLKPGRHWCPMCLAEQEAGGQEPYLKLIWQVEYIRRCDLHAVALAHKCPHCEKTQQYTSRALELSACSTCGKRLSETKVVEPMRYPSVGERDLLEVIEEVANNPGLEFDHNAPHIFFSEYQGTISRHEIVEAIGDVFHVRSSFVHPRLNTLLKLANYFQVPLLRILQDPSNASRQTSVGMFDCQRTETEKRRRNDAEKLKELEQGLLDAISTQGLPGSLSSICAKHEVSTGFAYHWCPALCKVLSSKRRKWTADRREKRFDRLKDSDVDELLGRYRRGQIGTLKDLTRQISLLTDVPIHMVRDYLLDMRFMQLPMKFRSPPPSKRTYRSANAPRD